MLMQITLTVMVHEPLDPVEVRRKIVNTVDAIDDGMLLDVERASKMEVE